MYSISYIFLILYMCHLLIGLASCIYSIAFIFHSVNITSSCAALLSCTSSHSLATHLFTPIPALLKSAISVLLVFNFTDEGQDWTKMSGI